MNERALLVSDSDMPAAQLRPIAGGQVAWYSARAPGKDTPNEDSAALIPIDGERCVLAVADGVGGLPSGEGASRLVIQELRAAVRKVAAENGRPLRGALLDAIERANRSILDGKSGGATTLVVAEIDGRSIRTYHVGDSGALVIGQRGRIKLQTIFHSPVGYAVEAGLLDEQEAIHHEDRHLISNAVGSEDMTVEVGSSIQLSRHDTLVIASDGLFDNLRTKEIAERVRKGPQLAGLTRLTEDGRGRMLQTLAGQPSKPDDLTVITFRRRG